MVGRQIKSHIPSLVKYRKTVGGQRQYRYYFQDLDICRAEFSEHTNINVEWEHIEDYEEEEKIYQ